MTDNADSTSRNLDAVNLESRPQPPNSLNSILIHEHRWTPQATPLTLTDSKPQRGSPGILFVDLYHWTG
jgi:hypothetical protein